MTTAELLAAFEGQTMPASEFGHREHLRVAWACLRLQHDEPAAAMARVARGLRAFAAYAGAPGRYHETITFAFMLLVRQRMGGPEETWEAFIAANDDLLDRKVLERYYWPETLASDRARRQFVMPDRAVVASAA